jgi:hypothetical protein
MLLRPADADIHRRVFGHCSVLSDTLPRFPLYRAFPGSEYYRGSAPHTPLSRRRANPRPSVLAGRCPRNATCTVPTFTDPRSTGSAPGCTPAASSRLRRRPSP